MSSSLSLHNLTTHQAYSETKQAETCLLPLSLKETSEKFASIFKKKKEMGTFLNRCYCVAQTKLTL